MTRADGSRALKVALALAGIAVAGSLVPQLLRKHPRYVLSNGVARIDFIVPWTPTSGGSVCQGRERVPGGISVVELYAGTYGRPGTAVGLTIEDSAGRLVTRGHVAPGWREPRLVVPVPRTPRGLNDATVCLRFGPGGHAALAGDPGLGPGGSTNGVPRPGRFRISYGTGQVESLAAIRGTIEDRYPRAHSRWLGVWTLWAAALALLGAGAAAGFGLWRGARP
jgi:hypothetical protein